MAISLRAIRKQRGLRLADAAKAIGTDSGNLSRIERGLQYPSRELAVRIVKVFPEISAAELLGFGDAA